MRGREESLTCLSNESVCLFEMIYLSGNNLVLCHVYDIFSDLFLSVERLNKQREKRSQNKLIDLLICFHIHVRLIELS